MQNFLHARGVGALMAAGAGHASEVLHLTVVVEIEGGRSVLGAFVV